MVQFMTRYPIPLQIEFTVQRFVEGMKWMPVVGLLVGAPAAVLLALTTPLLGNEVSTFLALVVLITVTGGLHLDGIGDTADGLFSYRSKDRMLEIMRDSTLGMNGVVAIILTILFKLITLINIPAPGAVIACICTPIVARMAIPWHTAFASYARGNTGMGEFTNGVGLSQALAATAISLILTSGILIFAALEPFSALFFSLVLHSAAAALAVAFARYLKRRLGGITGDTIGATIELCEMLLLLLFLSAWNLLL